MFFDYSKVFSSTCQLFSGETELMRFHLISIEKTGNRKDTCLLLCTRIIMTRFLILTTQFQYMSPHTETYQTIEQ